MSGGLFFIPMFSPHNGLMITRTYLMVIFFLVFCLFGYPILFGRTLAFAAKRLKIENVTFIKCLKISMISIITSLVLALICILFMSFISGYFRGPSEYSIAWTFFCKIVQFLVASAVLLTLFTILTAQFFNIDKKRALRLSLFTMLLNYILCLIGGGILFLLGILLLLSSPY